jgi:putative hydrolase of HD superfamily
MKKRNIDLLYEVGSMRNVQRSWRQYFGMDCANILEHSIRVALIALILGRLEGVKDEGKLLKMALVHDLPETRAGDLTHLQRLYSDRDEAKAAEALFADTNLEDLTEVLEEYEERHSIEAKIIKDADNLDVDLELRELADKGSVLPAQWKKSRKIIREKKLYTKSAKKLWDEIEKSNSHQWHVVANTWLKKSHAGK